MRSLLLLVTLSAFLCIAALKWDVILVAIGADKVLVPWGIAQYRHPKDILVGIPSVDETKELRAELITEENCLQCHMPSSAWLSFPHPSEFAPEADDRVGTK
ncbi:MAG: hypothetical protein AAF483_02340 [Planctomycetota bacterium]